MPVVPMEGVDNKVWEDYEKDARKSHFSLGRLRGGKVAGRKETEAKEMRGEEMGRIVSRILPDSTGNGKQGTGISNLPEDVN